MYSNTFTSKRGVRWNYDINYWGGIVQWHPTTVRCTGGWKTGPDTYSPKISNECFESILDAFGFERDPDHDDCVILPDFSQDVLIAVYDNEYHPHGATIHQAQDGRFRLSLTTDCWETNRMKVFDTFADAENYLLHKPYTKYTRAK